MSDHTTGPENPFSPPSADGGRGGSAWTSLDDGPAWPRSEWDQIEFNVDDVDIRWTGRTLELSGTESVSVRYESLGRGERVILDDEVVAITSVWHLSMVAPFIDFGIPSGGRNLPCRIEVKCSLFRLFRIVRFKLWVAGKYIYEEG